MRISYLIFTAALLAPAVRADDVRLMKTGDVALMQIHRDLTRAKRTIDVSTYIWDPCSTVSKMMLDDLRARARAGVRVRVLLDAYVQEAPLRRHFATYLGQLGIELRYFNERKSFDPMVNRRMHAKMIVVDGHSYYVGGRNIADDYFDMGRNNWLDRDVDVRGPSAVKAQAQFEMLWSSALTSPTVTTPAPGFAAWHARCLATRASDLRLKRVIARSATAILAAQPTHACTDVTPVVDEPDFLDAPGRIYLPASRLEPDQYARKHVSRAVVDFVGRSGNLSIENYTYVPDQLLDEALADRRARGVPIEVVTNHVMDQPPLQYLKEGAVTADNRGSQKVFELSNLGSLDFTWAMTPRSAPARWSIHSKVMTSGDDPNGPMRDTLVGSFNFDPRSYGTNLEAAVVVRDCPSLAAEQNRFVDHLRDVHRADLTCSACHEQPEISLADQLQAVIGRRLYFVDEP